MWDPGVIALMIPIVAIGGGIIAKIVQMWTNHEQEMARINSARQMQSGEYASSDIESLRQEIAMLRDTTTRYDLSVEQALQELRHRMGVVESRVAIPSKPQYAPPQATPEDQKVTLGNQ